MKLITKTILYYLLISLPFLVLAGILSYVLIRNEVRDGTDESLLREKVNVERMLTTSQQNEGFYLSSDSLSFAMPTNDFNTEVSFSDSAIFDKREMEEVNYRFLTGYFTQDHKNYLIKIAKPTFEEDELIEGLLSAFALIVGFLVLAFFIVNWLLSKTLWRPFHKTLSVLNFYDIKKYEAPIFETSTTAEFNQLNNVLNRMTEKIHSDFRLQKEFTENASHEMQTPIAVVKANISLMMQSPNLKEEEMNQLQTIENSLRKLSALNRTLILLTKIENNQFQKSEVVSMADTILRVIDNFSEFMESRKIQLKTLFANDIKVQIDPLLADVLISNLIQNAIRHNTDGGRIAISVQGSHLIISNSGGPLQIKEDALYVRFKKNDSSKDSLGLGLSIVKGIVDNQGYTISYHYQEGLHTFSLQFV